MLHSWRVENVNAIVRLILVLLVSQAQPAPGQIKQAQSALGQTKPPLPSAITIGSSEIAVGSPAPRTIATLQEEFKVDGGEGTSPVRQWFVQRTEKPNQIIGILYVKENVIVGVEHLVSAQHLISAEDAFNALYEVSSKLSADKARIACAISPWTNYNPTGLSVAGIHFDCGPYRIRFLREQFKDTTGVEVWEDLGATK